MTTFSVPARTTLRPRRYVSPAALVLLRPIVRFSPHRDAYVLRVIGNSRGPVLRRNRRRGSGDYRGPERRRALA